MADADYRRLAPACCNKVELRRASGRRPRGPFRCGFCGVSYTTTRKIGEGERFCTRECAFAFRSAQSIARAQAKDAAKQFTQLSNCIDCGASKHGRAKRCDRCAVAEQAHLSRIRYRFLNQKGSRLCPYCGAEWSAVSRVGVRLHCFTIECEQKHAAVAKRGKAIAKRGTKNHQSRAKRYGVERRYFNPVEVLQRDGWRCRLCGIKTPQRLRGSTEPNAPELDHIVPLSQGGSHTKQNTQCTCRRCNAAKGSKPLGQALLFG